MNSPFDAPVESDDRPTLGTGAEENAAAKAAGATATATAAPAFAVPPPLPPLPPDETAAYAPSAAAGGDYETVVGRPPAPMVFDVPPPLPPPFLDASSATPPPAPPLLSAGGGDPAASTQDELEPLETPAFPVTTVGLSAGTASPFDQPATTSAPPFPALDGTPAEAEGRFGAGLDPELNPLPAGEAAAAAASVAPEAAFASGERQTLVRAPQADAAPDAGERPFTGVAWLYFKDGPRRGLIHQFQKERTEVGRAADCDLRVEDDYASSRHAAFVYQNNEWMLYDFASTNGTAVNGRLLGRDVPMPFELSDGDVVVIGDTETVFKCII